MVPLCTVLHYKTYLNIILCAVALNFSEESVLRPDEEPDFLHHYMHAACGPVIVLSREDSPVRAPMEPETPVAPIPAAAEAVIVSPAAAVDPSAPWLHRYVWRRKRIFSMQVPITNKDVACRRIPTTLEGSRAGGVVRK
jgi:hypothetical protein